MSQPKILNLAAVIVLLFLSTAPPSSAGLWPWHQPEYRVHITNRLSSNEVLLVHCNSSDHDRGDSYINVGAEYEWAFKLGAIQMTSWRCYLAPVGSNRHVYFVAFDLDTPVIGKDAYWVVREDGAWISYDGREQLKYRWMTISIPFL
ncbi:hypothetical protein LINGRAHAP2_LOCUS12967 [Linum grandiflorum]